MNIPSAYHLPTMYGTPTGICNPLIAMNATTQNTHTTLPHPPEYSRPVMINRQQKPHHMSQNRNEIRIDPQQLRQQEPVLHNYTTYQQNSKTDDKKDNCQQHQTLNETSSYNALYEQSKESSQIRNERLNDHEKGKEKQICTQTEEQNLREVNRKPISNMEIHKNSSTTQEDQSINMNTKEHHFRLNSQRGWPPEEHFLWDFQKKEIKILLPNMDDHTRCYDTNDPLDSFQLPIGRGGVSVLWPSQWSSRIKKLKDGNERIIAILITATKDICLINSYMPTHNSDSLSEYTECLDIIYDIIQKYENTHKIVLAGDLNGTLQTSRTNKHDKMLRNFAKNMNLKTGVELVNTHTFFHHAGNSSSQIDYILVQDENLVEDYTIEEISCANTSAHTIVKMEIASQMTKIRK
ncbi:unnamed protein product [Mytilus coruscus]|uniref:Endonuclease/exonuclease/phosphatase domain-containing protein n=1 Tax=Mytilus coruscus TaxID=42192 RepID=A0A6J8A4C7_MYTCO|nr:unnamed protein product [Mytilus coruscus]